MTRFLATLLTTTMLCAGVGTAADKTVGTISALVSAVESARAGDRIRVAPGTYPGIVRVRNLKGTAEDPIVIEARDPKAAPVFGGRATAFHLSDCEHVILRRLRVKGCSANGINIDDAGSKESPSSHIVLEGIVIENTGPSGNRDALKLSGVDHFEVKDCTIHGWGGSGIDMVGCHDGVIRGCRFEGKTGYSQANAIQIKGGSARIQVTRNVFLHAGQRAVNIGGSTGLPYFRPEVTAYEASKVEVADNLFIGSMAPVAWVNADGGHVHHNTIYHPEKWVIRILQESQGKQFLPSHDGLFEDNLIVFDRRVRVFANVGGGTDQKSFTFRRNAWFRSDGRGGSLRPPPLPTVEKDGVYGVDPMLKDTGTAKMRVGSSDKRLQDKGRREKSRGDASSD